MFSDTNFAIAKAVNGLLTDAISNTDSSVKLVANQEKAYLKKVYFFHALVIAPLLIYIGFTGQKTNPSLFGALGGLGVVAMIYHGMRLKFPREVWM